ncbi:MAG: hypothetical protein QXR73_02940 [Candidatus Micrarchaeaceae archaeon]
MSSKYRMHKQIEEFEERKKQLLRRRESLYDEVERRGDDITNGRHPIRNSLALSFAGDRIRDLNRQIKKTQEYIDSLRGK